MEQAKGVKVVEVCRVAPPTNSSSTPTSLPLTFFDIHWLRIPPTESVYFYEIPKLTTSFFDSSIVPNLKHSLSLTLQHFLPIAGSIIWPLDSPHPIINYVPGNAVSLTIAESNTDFNMLCSNTCVASQLESLIPRFTTSHEEAPVITLQVTLFPSSGFSLGVAAHHAAMDGKAFFMFLKAWAYVCSNNNNLTDQSSFLSLPKHLIPFYDRSTIRDTAEIGATSLEGLLNDGGSNNRSVKSWDLVSPMSAEAIRGSFELTSSNIQKLKEHAKSKLKDNDARRLSTFQVTCAYVLQCWMKAEEPKTNGVAFVFSVDCRSRLQPPIPCTYFGNCAVGHKVIDETKNWLGDDGFINTLKAIREALHRLEDGFLSGVITFTTVKEISISNTLTSTVWSPKFDVYSIDFGWGRTKKMDITSIRKSGGFCLSDSPNDNGGLEISLMLNKQQMETFTAHFTEGLESL